MLVPRLFWKVERVIDDRKPIFNYYMYMYLNPDLMVTYIRGPELIKYAHTIVTYIPLQYMYLGFKVKGSARFCLSHSFLLLLTCTCTFKTTNNYKMR